MTGPLDQVARTVLLILARFLAVGMLLSIPRLAFAVEGTVVLVTPDEPDLDAAVRDAATAQFSGMSVELVLEHFRPPESTLRAQADAARLIAAEARATGVFWLDTRTKEEWLLFLAEPGTRRLLMRRIPLENGATAAGAESVAVIVRQSSEALLSGQTISMQPIILPEEKPAICPEPQACKMVPAPKPKGRGGPLFGVTFYGDRFDSRAGFQPGIRVAASWLTSLGIYGGIGYAHLRDAAVSTSNIAFRLRRVPLDVHVGYALLRGRFVPALELRAIVDVVTRKNGATIQSLDATPENTRVLVSVSPRARLDFAVTPVAALQVAVGPDLVLNTFSYVIREDSQDVAVVDPYRLRPAFEVGITVRL